MEIPANTEVTGANLVQQAAANGKSSVTVDAVSTVLLAPHTGDEQNHQDYQRMTSSEGAGAS
jgi:hypothetical protein